MSLFETASLVVTPNGVKTSKLYAIKPTDGSGDLDVVRATSATRVDANGLVEIPRTNLATYSEQFDNALWVKTRATITSNSTTAPDGTSTADKLIEDINLLTHDISRNITLVNGVVYSFSFFAKKAERNWVAYFDNSSGGFQYFDLQNGVLGSSAIGSGKIENYGNDWFRCTYIFTQSGTTGRTNIRISTANGVSSYLGNGTSGVYVWGAMLQEGNVATEYIPTVASIRTKFAGITQDGSSASNIPRLDYTNSTCPSILVEPQRTNLVLRSNELTNVYYDTSGATIAQSSTNFLNGEKAFLLGETSLNSQHFISTISTLPQVIGTTYTYSCYLKKGSGSAAPDIVRLRAFYGENFANFNISTGQVLSTSSQLTSASITSISNGYYRCSITWVGVTASSTYAVIYLINNTNNLNLSVSYVGNVNANVFVAGWQYEVGANATSYIPTVASTVTRNADVISKTGISSLIGQTEGTLYAEVNVNNWTNLSRIFSISDGTSTNRIMTLFNTSNRFRVIIDNLGGAAQADISSSSLSNGIHKIAVGYKANDVVFYVDGVLVGSDTSATIPTCSAVYLGKIETSASSNFLDDRINSAILFKTRLTNAELATLTTL